MDQSFDVVGIMNTLTALVMEYGLRALGGLALFLVGKWVAGRIRAGLRYQLERSSLDPTLIPFASGMVYWALMAFVILAVLNLIGVQTASAIAVLGAAGLAVGLALQGTLSNFAAGVMLLLFRPFHVGDWVEVASTSGTVKEIGLFSTALNSGDNIRVTIPNSQVYGQTIRNFSTNDNRRIDLVMGVSYDDDLQVAREVMERVLGDHEKVLADPAPLVAVDELADSSVNFVVRPWCRREDYWAVRRELTLQMKLELEAAGCSIPYPQRDVHLHQVESGPSREG
jgi:small conductance mechanosensitive channel